MKKLPGYLTITLLLVLFSFACRRDDMAIKKETLNYSVDQAKAWFTLNSTDSRSSSLPKTQARIINGLPDNKKTLLWKFAIQKKNKQVEAVEVPYVGTNMVLELPDSSYKNNSERDALVKGISKRVVIYKKPNGTIEIILVHIVPSYNYLLSHPNHFKDNYFLNLDKDFTGWIYTYAWNENPKSISEIKNGKLLKGRTRIIRDSSATQINNRYEYTCFQNCSPVFIGTVGANCGNPGDQYYDDCVYNSQAGTGSWTTVCRWDCGYIWIPDSPNNGNNSGGGTPPDDCNYYGTCDDPYANNENKFIIDSLTGYPCAQNILATMPNLNNKTMSLIQNIFNTNADINLRFSVDQSLRGTTTDGHHVGGGAYIFNGRIGINPDVLEKASREYMLVTFFHEALHAYYRHSVDLYLAGQLDSITFKNNFSIFWNPNNLGVITHPSELAEHEQMAIKYVSDMYSIIKTFNPNINDEFAYALAWGGLEETRIYRTRVAGLNIGILNQIGRDVNFRMPSGYAIPEYTNYSNYNATKCP